MSLLPVILSSMMFLTPTMKETPKPAVVRAACAFATSNSDDVIYSPCNVIIGETKGATWVAFDTTSSRIIYLGVLASNGALEVGAISINGKVTPASGACASNGSNKIQCVADVEFVTTGVIAVAQ